MNNKSHEFALFSKEFSQAVANKKNQVIISDTAIIHRIQHVLRLNKEEVVVLFDDEAHSVCTLIDYPKGRVTLALGTLIKNTPVLPKLTVILPLLKREALDEVVYACREFGVSAIQFVSTDKSSRQALSFSERERLERVSVAAAEQSKNFAPCALQDTLPSLIEFLENSEFTNTLKVYADPEGFSWQQIVSKTSTDTKEFVICVGPEGDMSDREKALLHEHGFVFCKLGSTILRAQQAATLLIGIVRTCR